MCLSVLCVCVVCVCICVCNCVCDCVCKCMCVCAYGYVSVIFCASGSGGSGGSGPAGPSGPLCLAGPTVPAGTADAHTNVVGYVRVYVVRVCVLCVHAQDLTSFTNCISSIACYKLL